MRMCWGIMSMSNISSHLVPNREVQGARFAHSRTLCPSLLQTSLLLLQNVPVLQAQASGRRSHRGNSTLSNTEFSTEFLLGTCLPESLVSSVNRYTF